MEISYLREFKRDNGSLYVADSRNEVSSERIFVKRTSPGNQRPGPDLPSNEAFTLIALQASKWIPRFRVLWERSGNTYMGTELLTGGDLMMLLENHPRLSAAEVRIVAAQLLEAMDSIHSLGFVHRDLKPENICFDRLGFLKIVDFKAAHRLGSESGAEGLPVDYMAPEVITRTTGSYDQAVDIWSFGIIVYEMLFGGPPFSDELRDRNKAIYRIINSEKYLWFPPEVDDEVSSGCDLIRAALRPVSTRISISGIKSHKFFGNIKWGKLTPFQTRGERHHIFRE